MGKYRHHKYEWSKPFGSVRHNWSFLGPIGGVNFHVTIPEARDWEPSAGLEYHHARVAQYRANEAPDHKECWLTGEPCWHDGTSLYATESLWPMIKACLWSGDHDAIFHILEGEADQHFDPMALANRVISREQSDAA